MRRFRTCCRPAPWGGKKSEDTRCYILTSGSAASDIAPVLAPRPGDPIVTSGPDKFLDTDLEKILKERNIKTVIVTGTAAHGAVICTAGGAAFRGMKVIIPEDGISSTPPG